MIRFVADLPALDAARGEDTPRTITGIAVPWDTVATVSGGQRVTFARGAFDTNQKPAKLLENHDLGQLRGTVTALADLPEGLGFTASFARTTAANDAIELVKAGAYDAVSVGADPVESHYDKALRATVVTKARLVELSLVAQPAFTDAVITEIVASEPEDDNEPTPIVEPEEDSIPMSEPELVEAAAPTVIPTPAIPATPKREYPMPTAAEFAAAYHMGGDSWRNVQAAYQANVEKNRTAIQAAQDLSSDVPGLLPLPVVAPLFENINYIRPVVTAFGTRALPNGNGISFVRPTISQHTTSGVQNTQGTAVASQTMTIAANTVNRQTVAGSVFISQQAMDFTDPAAMNSILTDLSGQYLRETDDIASTALVAAATASGYTWTVTPGDPSSLIEALYGCAENISTGTNLFPTHLVASVDVWKALGSQVDDVNRPVFPAIGAPGLLGMNTLGAGDATSWSGMNPLGLRIVVDGNLASDTMLVVHAPAVEFYENVRGVMSLEDPTNLGRTFTYYGYFATFFQKAVGDTTDSTFVQSIALA
jgi:HK97 family phage prohead protease